MIVIAEARVPRNITALSNVNRRRMGYVSALDRTEFHNLRLACHVCSSKAKMSALSKIEMSVSAPFWEFGGCRFDGHGGDELRHSSSNALSGIPDDENFPSPTPSTYFSTASSPASVVGTVFASSRRASPSRSPYSS